MFVHPAWPTRGHQETRTSLACLDEPMAARKSTRVNRKYKTKYRVTKWQEYERGLRSRGDITVWFSDEAREAWTPPNNGRRGG